MTALLTDLWDAWQAIQAEFYGVTTDADGDRLSAEQASIERQIADTPAADVTDILAKVALVRTFVANGAAAPDKRDVRLVDGLADDLRRLMGESAPALDPVII